MPIIRFRPTLTKSTDLATKPAAYGVYTKPTSPPTYPVVLADVSGKGSYRVLVVGDGDATASVNVYVDGATTPTDSITCDTPTVIEGTFNTSVSIRLEGSGLPSSLVYNVLTENTMLKDVSIS